jgi:hypothetical protein
MFAVQSAAQAADTAELTVKGSITTSACTPTLDKQAVDFGTTMYATIPENGLELDSRPVAMTIQCPTPMRVGFTANDNRKASAESESDTSRLGLGYAADGVTKLGTYTLGISNNTTVDGTKSPALQTADGTAWTPIPANDIGNGYTGDYVAADASRTYTAATPSGQPAEATVTQYEMYVHPTLRARDALNLTEDAHFDGSITFSLVYL